MCKVNEGKIVDLKMPTSPVVKPGAGFWLSNRSIVRSMSTMGFFEPYISIFAILDAMDPRVHERQAFYGCCVGIDVILW